MIPCQALTRRNRKPRHLEGPGFSLDIDGFLFPVTKELQQEEEHIDEVEIET